MEHIKRINDDEFIVMTEEEYDNYTVRLKEREDEWNELVKANPMRLTGTGSQ